MELTDVLRGDVSRVAALADHWSSVRRAAEYHRVLPLIGKAILALPEAPPAVRQELTQRARQAAIGEVLREAELTALLDALDEASVRCLVFKGAALAYTCYDRPELRPRTDTDLLVSAARRPAAERVLGALGYEAAAGFSGDLVAYQAAFVKRRAGIPVHVVDLHWRIATPQVFGDILPFEEAASEAVPVPALGAGARALSPVHALLVACVHRVAHHSGDARLIWLVDIGRIAAKLTRDEWTRFLRLALDRRVAMVCRSGLMEVAGLFAVPVPEDVMTALERQAHEHEPTAAFLKRRRHAAVVAQDFATLPDWSGRFRMLRQHALPPASYMRNVYAPGSHFPLPVLYAKRALRGAWKWLVRG